MKHSFYMLALTLVALPLTGCGGGGGDGTHLTVDELGAGAYTVSTGNADSPTVGSYYADTDGNRLLVLNNSDGQADVLYRRDVASAWVAVPAVNQNLTVRLLRSDAVPVVAVSAAALAGGYVTQLSSGSAAAFTVNADGTVVAGSTACKLSGKLAAGTLPNTLKLSLTATGCGALPGASTGVVAVNSDDAPARFRLIADDGAQVIDLWAFAE